MIQGSKNLEFQIDIMIRFSNILSTSCVDTMVIILQMFIIIITLIHYFNKKP